MGEKIDQKNKKRLEFISDFQPFYISNKAFII